MNDRFLEELPDSDVSNLIRQKRGLALRAKPLLDSNLTSENEGGSENAAHQDDYSYFESTENNPEKKNPSMTYDTLRFYNRMKYQPQPEIIDEKTENLNTDYMNTTKNSNIVTTSENENSKMTYEMLREQNRMKYDKTYVQTNNKSEETVKSRAYQKSPEIEEKLVKSRSLNKYGDETFD